MNSKFKGVYAVQITPFFEDGAFDIENAKKHLDWLIEAGVSGVCILGATSEYQSVNNEEYKYYLGQILPYIKGRVSVVVGVTREMTDEVIELMNAAQALGAEAGMLLPPVYCHPGQEEILENYRYIASKSTLPIIIYNNPGSAGVDISRETLQEILKLPTAQILKESTGDIHRLTEAVIDAPDHTSVFCGCDSLPMESFLMGAVGWISMTANFAPKDCVALLNAVKNGEHAKAMEIYTRLLPALNHLESTTKPAATIKYILKKYRGLESGHMRRPRMDLNKEEMMEVDALMNFSSIS